MDDQILNMGDNDSWCGPNSQMIDISESVFIPSHLPTNIRLTPDQVGYALRWWQSQLKLDHWIMDHEIDRGFDMGDALGHCKWTLTKHRATIRLMNPDDHSSGYDPYDMEQVIVHELLHLHFAAWLDLSYDSGNRTMTDVENAVCMEQPIERLAWVLTLQRRANPNQRMPWDSDLLMPPQPIKPARTTGAQRAP